MKDAMLIIHMLGLVMGLGTGFAHMFLGMATKKLPEDEQDSFQLKTIAIGMMGRIGLVMLIISGGYLMTPYWATLTQTPILMAKMGLVLTLIVLIGIMDVHGKKAKAENGGPHLAKLEVLGKIALPVGIGIVICAVLAFH